MILFLEQYAKEQEDWPEFKPFEAGVKRGKVWVAPKVAEPKESIGEISVELDLEDDAKTALESATPAELVDLAGKQFVMDSNTCQ